MKFIHRLGYYLGGFSIGLIVLAFFLSGKKTSCDYFPQARVLKNIRTKKIDVSALEQEVQKKFADSLFTATFFKNAQVDFDGSEPRKEPCGLFLLNSEVGNMPYTAKVANCDTLVKVLSFSRY